MPVTIEINPLSPTSLIEAANRVREYEERFREKQVEYVKRLAEEGVEVAKVKFDQAILGYDGDQTQITVTQKQEGFEAEIIASGKTVAFLEFGAGIAHPEHSTGLYKHGTYGKGYGMRRQWGFYSDPGDKKSLILTTGNDPAEAMTGALKRDAEIFASVAREVFGSD